MSMASPTSNTTSSTARFQQDAGAVGRTRPRPLAGFRRQLRGWRFGRLQGEMVSAAIVDAGLIGDYSAAARQSLFSLGNHGGIVHEVGPFARLAPALQIAIALTAIGNAEHVVRLAGAARAVLAALTVAASLHLGPPSQALRPGACSRQAPICEPSAACQMSCRVGTCCHA